MADAIRAFEGASLFIDDCMDGTIVCVNRTTTGAPAILEDETGYCWDTDQRVLPPRAWGSTRCSAI